MTPSNDNDQEFDTAYEELYQTLNGLNRLEDIERLLALSLEALDAAPTTLERHHLMGPVIVLTRLVRDRGGDPMKILYPENPR